MHLRTFSAGTMAEALYQVKSAMGNDAVILHTRTYFRRRWLGLRRVEVVEITAGDQQNEGERHADEQRRPIAVAADQAEARGQPHARRGRHPGAGLGIESL